MSRVSFSVSMPTELHDEVCLHLLRQDGQEDICFALWYPSQGNSRFSAVLQQLILPKEGDRNVHGNASFESTYFERALSKAAAEGAGLALLHSHPRGLGWQDMSPADVCAEQGNAGVVFGATGFPLLGLTLAKDRHWSARFWHRSTPRTYVRMDCGTVRVVGNELRASYCDSLAPVPAINDLQIRTISAWGDAAQADLVRLRIGIVGAGSVGGMIGDALARMGFEDIILIDFDHVEMHNLDRLVYALPQDVGKLKVEVQANHLRSRATANPFHIEPVVSSVCKARGYSAALDCDLLFSCVDRPWARYVLNLIAYAHLIPVIDGGILVRANRLGRLAAADWRAHIAAPGRRCLQCIGQYDPALVQMEREGMLEDPSYIEGLPSDHPLKARQNVFVFSMSCASMQVLQMLALVLSPLGLSNQGTQLYHFVGGVMENPDFSCCHSECQFSNLVGLGDRSGVAAIDQ